ncbi:MAG TPA: GntR family transcriptional regulator [Terriglobales bacterium]|nr:GntR family transcriptional regulator [Terriglobales bacterium]
MISIDYRDRRSIYEQLVERITSLAASGFLSPGSQLPSVRQLAGELSINPNTIQRAYAELERAGVTYTVKGRGSFVTEDTNLLRTKMQDELFEDFNHSAHRAIDGGVPPARLISSIESIEKEAGNK